MLRHVKASQLTVGERIAGVGTLTMIGPSSTTPGWLFVGIKTPAGFRTNSMSPDVLVQVDMTPTL